MYHNLAKLNEPIDFALSYKRFFKKPVYKKLVIGY